MKFRLIPYMVVPMVASAVLSSCTSRTVLQHEQAGSQRQTVRVWFVKASGQELVLVPVDRPRAHGDTLDQAVRELLAGPTNEELKRGVDTEIPRGTILLSVKAAGDDVELNLSRRFASGGGSDSLETRLAQLQKTVEDSAGSRKVYLAVEGERLSAAAGEGLEVKQPLN